MKTAFKLNKIGESVWEFYSLVSNWTSEVLKLFFSDSLFYLDKVKY